ncbi:MAG: UTP--glucose-1-phosphate uridylyltransferase, partial [Candidatus Omnitrophota bacterium]
MIKTNHRVVAIFTFLFFVVSQVAGPVGQVHAQSVSSEVRTAPEFQLNVPSDLGTIESILAGHGPALIHIQTAHGNYEAQKKIQGILHYLKDQYDVKTLFIEGSSFQLDPEMLRFFPDYMDKTMEVNDALTKEAIVKGPELFLLEEPEAKAYGIEDVGAYRANLEAFRAVLTQKEQTENFISNMDLQIERLTSPFLSKDLRAFLKRLEAYELNQLPLDAWLAELKSSAAKVLETDLSSPSWQIEWPMLVRVFTLRALESKLDMPSYNKEKEAFLKAIKAKAGDAYERIEALLKTPLSQHRLPDPETSLLFERLVSALPQDFKYADYPQTTSFIAHLILQSELKSDLLVEEIERLTDRIQNALVTTEEEKKILGMLKDHRLMKKLFALELTPREYGLIEGVRERMLPSTMTAGFSALNGAKRVRDVEFANIDQVDALFNKALEFYAGTKKRDEAMLSNIASRMRELGDKKVVVVTGGFHADPFRQYFSSKDYSYALITPKITEASGKDAYLKVMLGKLPIFPATIESVSNAASLRDRGTMDDSNAVLQSTVAELTQVAGEMAAFPELPLANSFSNSAVARDWGATATASRNDITVSGTYGGALAGLLNELGVPSSDLVFPVVPGSKVVTQRTVNRVAGVRLGAPVANRMLGRQWTPPPDEPKVLPAAAQVPVGVQDETTVPTRVEMRNVFTFDQITEVQGLTSILDGIIRGELASSKSVTVKYFGGSEGDEPMITPSVLDEAAVREVRAVSGAPSLNEIADSILFWINQIPGLARPQIDFEVKTNGDAIEIRQVLAGERTERAEMRVDYFLQSVTGQEKTNAELMDKVNPGLEAVMSAVEAGVRAYLQAETDKKVYEKFPEKSLASTLASVREWLTSPAVSVYTKRGILKAVAKARWMDINSLHSGKVKFGTAGVRAVAAAGLEDLEAFQEEGFHAETLQGPGSINPVTIALVTTGVARYYRSIGRTKVSITYDSRVYGQALADYVADIFLREGLTVHLFDESAPMPEMAFSVAGLKLDLGILISASHNPAEYQGYKVSNGVGAQLDPASRDGVMDFIYGNSAKNIPAVTLDDVAAIIAAAAAVGDPLGIYSLPPRSLGPLVRQTMSNLPKDRLVILGDQDIEADADGYRHIDIHNRHARQVVSHQRRPQMVAEWGPRLRRLHTAQYGNSAKADERVMALMGIKGTARVREFDFFDQKFGGRRSALFPLFTYRTVDGRPDRILPDPGNSTGLALAWEMVLQEYLKQVRADLEAQGRPGISDAEVMLEAFKGLDVYDANDPDSDRFGALTTVSEEEMPEGLDELKPIYTKTLPKDLPGMNRADKARIAQLICLIVPKELRGQMGFAALRLRSANEIWSLIVKYSVDAFIEMQEQGRLPKGAKFTIIRTHVTTRAVDAIAAYARKRGLDVEIREPFVGYSLIAELIQLGWEKGEINLAGIEESGGYSEGGAPPIFYALGHLFQKHAGLDLTLQANGALVSSVADPLLALDEETYDGQPAMRGNLPKSYYGYNPEEIRSTLEYLVANGLLVKETMPEGVRYSLAEAYQQLRTGEHDEFWKPLRLLALDAPGERLGKRGHTLEKDGMLATAMLDEVATYAKSQGKTLAQMFRDELDLNPEIGHFASTNQPLQFEPTGPGTQQKIGVIKNLLALARAVQAGQQIMIDNKPVQKVQIYIPAAQKYVDAENFPVAAYEDLLALLSDGNLRDDKQLLKSFFPEEGVRFVIEGGFEATDRPSGTEPKLRFYVDGVVTELTLRDYVQKILDADLAVMEVAFSGMALAQQPVGARPEARAWAEDPALTAILAQSLPGGMASTLEKFRNDLAALNLPLVKGDLQTLLRQLRATTMPAVQPLVASATNKAQAALEAVLLEELSRSVDAVTWSNDLDALAVMAPDDVINVTIAINRGISMRIPVPLAVWNEPGLTESLYRYLATRAYALSIDLGTDRIAFGTDRPEVSLDIARLKNLLTNANALGNVRESLGEIKHPPYTVANYANAGKPVAFLPADMMSTMPKMKPYAAAKAPQFDWNAEGIYLGVDVGGSSMRFLVMADGEKLELPEDLRVMPTISEEDRNGTDFVARFRAQVGKIQAFVGQRMSGRKIAGVAVDIPGAIDFEANRVATLGQITAKKNWGQAEINQIGELATQVASELGVPDSHVLVRNDMDGIGNGIVAFLADVMGPDFLRVTEGNFGLDYHGNGHGNQNFIEGVLSPSPTEIGHVFHTFGKPGDNVYDTEAYTSIPSLIQYARELGFPGLEGNTGQLKPIGDAAVNAGHEQHAIAIKVFERFAYHYARNLILQYDMAQRVQGVKLNGSDVLLGGGITRGGTGEVIRDLTLAELKKLGYENRIRFYLLNDDALEETMARYGMIYDDLGAFGSAALIQQHIRALGTEMTAVDFADDAPNAGSLTADFAPQEVDETEPPAGRPETRATYTLATIATVLDRQSLSEQQDRALQMLFDLDQGHLFNDWAPVGQMDAEKKAFLDDVVLRDSQYPGGLRAYHHNAVQGIAAKKAGVNEFAGLEPRVPQNLVDLTQDMAQFRALQTEGMSLMGKTAVAAPLGGQGQRLGYPGIKVGIPFSLTADEMTYLQWFIDWQMALSGRASGRPHYTMMLSDQTKSDTEALLAANRNFGLTSDELDKPVQGAVPSVVDTQGHFTTVAGNPYLLLTQPHGHGDIHMLIHMHQIVKRLLSQNQEYIVFHQDTNGQTFNAVPAVVQVSKNTGMAMNLVAVPREAGEATGAVVDLYETATGQRRSTQNVEYDKLGPLLRDTVNPQGDVPDPQTGLSPFPGNINVYVLHLPDYAEVLEATNGLIEEFINPKARPDGTFKPTRLETLMQEIAISFSKLGKKVGTTVLDKRLVFSPVKNDPLSGALLVPKGIYPDTMATAEADLHQTGRRILDMAGMKVNVPGVERRMPLHFVETKNDKGEVASRVLANPETVQLGANQELKTIDLPFNSGAMVVLQPSFATTIDEAVSKIRGGSITDKSSLVVEGEGVALIENLNLDGALVIRAPKGVNLTVRNLTVLNAGWEFVDLTPAEMVDKATPPYLSMRGYKLVKHDAGMILDLTGFEPGNYTVGADGQIVRSEQRNGANTYDHNQIQAAVAKAGGTLKLSDFLIAHGAHVPNGVLHYTVTIEPTANAAQEEGLFPLTIDTQADDIASFDQFDTVFTDWLGMLPNLDNRIGRITIQYDNGERTEQRNGANTYDHNQIQAAITRAGGTLKLSDFLIAHGAHVPNGVLHYTVTVEPTASAARDEGLYALTIDTQTDNITSFDQFDTVFTDWLGMLPNLDNRIGRITIQYDNGERTEQRNGAR